MIILYTSSSEYKIVATSNDHKAAELTVPLRGFESAGGTRRQATCLVHLKIKSSVLEELAITKE